MTKPLHAPPPSSPPVERLLAIMRQLRAPVGGCPWDLKQDFASIAKHTLEEAYEVIDAIERQDWQNLKGELGDLLFQVVFYAQMAAERGWYDFDAVVDALCDKLIRRHPHIFPEQAAANAGIVVKTAQDQVALWEKLKAEEKAAASPPAAPPSALDGITLHLPALARAVKIQGNAARTGFDWQNPRDILAKLQEEILEVQAEIDQGGSIERLTDEVGDLLFVVSNLARRLEIDPETCLRHANDKFTRRFRLMEDLARQQGKAFTELSVEAQDDLWREVKRREKVAAV